MPADHLKAVNPKTGVEGYRVGLEVFHQLHCINLLRQVTYKEYYIELGNGNFASGEEELKMHTGKNIRSFIMFYYQIILIIRSRSLSRDIKKEHSVHRRHWRLHLLSSSRRPTPMARTQHQPHVQKLR